MNSIRLVTHCYAGKLPQYAFLLRYHLIALEQAEHVRVTVCAAFDDELTREVLGPYQRSLGRRMSVDWMPVRELGRRAIGRNRAALTSTEDLLIFTDVDYVWMWSSLQFLGLLFWPIDQDGVSMVYPREIEIAKDHATGDEIWKRAIYDTAVKILPAEYVPKTYNRAIGGCQIVQGSLARQYGYLKDTKWLEPQDGEPFSDFTDDIAYRRACLATAGRIIGIHIPDVYRIRHSEKTY